MRQPGQDPTIEETPAPRAGSSGLRLLERSVRIQRVRVLIPLGIVPPRLQSALSVRRHVLAACLHYGRLLWERRVREMGFDVPKSSFQNVTTL